MEKNDTSLTVSKLQKEIELLKEKTALADLNAGRTKTYIKDKIYKHRKLWWETFEQMITSDEKDLKKAAFIEYNKLQGKVLPTQLEGSNGQSVVLNLIGMGIDAPEQKTPTDDFVEAEYTEK